MQDGNEVKKYRKEKTLELVEKYKDLIDKTFEILDKDLLQNKIDSADSGNEGGKETEEKYLESIKKRRMSLDEVDVMLDKIEKLEGTLFNNNQDGDEIQTTTSSNPTKRFARKEQK